MSNTHKINGLIDSNNSRKYVCEVPLTPSQLKPVQHQQDKIQKEDKDFLVFQIFLKITVENIFWDLSNRKRVCDACNV